ncbi:MAG: EAL domain-containing protein [Thermomicrobiales bacterium]
MGVLQNPESPTIVLKTDPGSSRCSRCETVPPSVPLEGDLHLWFPLGHSLGKVARCMRDSSINFEFADNGRSLIAHLAFGEFAMLAGQLDAVMSHEEKLATRSLLLPSGEQPDYQDFGRVTPLGQLIARSSANWLLEILREMRLTSHFQSIVHANDPQRRFAREGLLRGLDRSGALISPFRMYQVARDADLLFQLDLAARRTVIGELDRHSVTEERTFINFTPTSIYDPVFCLRSTVAASTAQVFRTTTSFSRLSRRAPDSPDHLRNIWSSTGRRVSASRSTTSVPATPASI